MSFTILGRVQVFTKGGSMKGTVEGGAPVGELGGIFPWKFLQFLVLGNAISGILKQSQRALMSHYFKLKFRYFWIKI